MFVPLSWLKEYVKFDLSAGELAEKLDLSGTAVERTIPFGEELEDVVVGQIKEIRPHPKADNLVVCKVDVGGSKRLSIVCGAKNMKRGDKVPVALVGAKLAGGEVIRKTSIRGVPSEGMICSEAELGLGRDTSGLMILEATFKVGEKLTEALGLKDTILELEVTPNRPDCLGMIGVAREVAALTKAKLRKPRVSLKETNRLTSEMVEVKIADVNLCPRYVARVIEGVKVGTSPLWMQRRLKMAGIRPINNVVDVTNYVMLETGQPLHAFDYNCLKKGKIIVRLAKLGETLTTLDGVTRQLDETMLTIADSLRPVALAGVMGGAESEVLPTTKNVLLESANFSPQTIMRTSQKLGLFSESSSRFEKGVDPSGALLAADRAAQLIEEVAGGKVLKKAVDAYPKKIKPLKVSLRPARVNAVLGTSLSAGEMAKFLRSLELEVSPLAKSGQPTRSLKVTIPTFRPDLEREIDLIEEIARLYGFDKVVSTLPESSGKQGRLSQSQRVEERIKDILVGVGLFEVISYSFISLTDLDRISLPSDFPLRSSVALQNPLSEDQSIMRTTLLPGLLRVAQYNVSRDESNVAIFEVGRVFRPLEDGSLPEEIVMIGALLTGAWQKPHWHQESRKVDFFDLKGVLEDLMSGLGIEDWFLRPAIHPTFHPGRCAEVFIGGSAAGMIGEIHPRVQSAFGLPNLAVAFELEQAKLISATQWLKKIQEVPRYPGISLDIALVVDEKVTHGEVKRVIQEAAGKLLQEVYPFDLYRGKQILLGKKSLAYSLVYRSKSRTLTEKEVEKIQQRVVARLKKELGAEIRA